LAVLAFVLKSEQHPFVAVSSFVDIAGENKLYIASNEPMTDAQQQEITEIINLFLDMKPHCCQAPSAPLAFCHQTL
jgi:hypothetical protein